MFTNLVNGESFSGSQLEDCSDAVCKSIGIEKTYFLVFESSDLLNNATKYLPELGNSRVLSDYKNHTPSRGSNKFLFGFLHFI